MTHPLKNFVDLWIELGKQNHASGKVSFEKLRNDWLIKLEFSEKERHEIEKYINAFLNYESVTKITLVPYKLLLSVTHKKLFKIPLVEKKFDDIKEEKFKEILSDSEKELINVTNSQIYALLLIAFVLAAIGIAIYLLNQKQNDVTDGKDNYGGSDSYSLPKTSKTIVFFALNANSAEKMQILVDLKDQQISQKVISFMGKTQKIKTLWQGTEEEFSKFGIDQCWTSSLIPKDQDDIYLVKMVLDNPEPEFQEGSLATNWRRAFQRIAENRKIEIEVSKRKPKEAVNNPHLKTP